MINTEFLRVSNGTGEAVLATVTVVRLIGSTSLVVDTLARYPAKCIVTTGTLDAAGFINPATMTVMRGTTSGSTITITGYEPGYTDVGNTISQKVVIKPVTSHTDQVITALETLDTEVLNRSVESIYDYIVSGGVWAGLGYNTTLTASMTAIPAAYQGGFRNTSPIALIPTRTFTASRDTYIDILRVTNITSVTMSIVYTEVANNAASPALAANSIRLAIIVSGANILNVGSINQGQEEKVLPVITNNFLSVTDSLGNLICPRDPERTILGQRRITTTFDVSANTATLITNAGGTLSVPVIIPNGRKVEILVDGDHMRYATAAGSVVLSIHPTSVATARLRAIARTSSTANAAVAAALSVVFTPTTSSMTFVAGLLGDSAAVVSGFITSATSPGTITVKLV